MKTTATLSDETPVDPDDELLVAYLDGELDRKERTTVEDRLMEEPALRKRLQQLQTGWELLDDLPDPTPSMQLVESTLELVVDDIVKQQAPAKSRWRQYRFPLLVALGSLLAALLVVGVVLWQRHEVYQQQLRDLAIVQYLDAYQYGGDTELMRRLLAEPEWMKMVSAAQEVSVLRPQLVPNVAAVPVDRREQFIEALPPEDTDQLIARWDRFNRLEESQQQQIRQTAEAVAVQPDAKTLLKTMQMFAVWRETIPAKLRDSIENGSQSERREALQEAIDYTKTNVARRSGINLDEKTTEAIYAALQQILNDRINDGDEATINSLERWEGDPDGEFFTIARIVFSGQRGSSRGGPRGPSKGSAGNDRPRKLNEQELEVIRWALPRKAIETLSLVAAGELWIESMTLQIWTEETVRRRFPRRQDEATALQRYQELSDRERDVIDLLPPKDFFNELLRRYGRFPD